jgi:hypothetical protein
VSSRGKVDYTALTVGYKAVILGESHHATVAYQNEVASSLKELKRLGFTHFGLEMLQTDLSSSSDKTNMENIRDTFYPGHVRVYEAAIHANFKIVPLDMPIAQQQAYKASSLQKRYRDRNHWMAKAALKDLNAGHKMVLFMHHGHAIGSTGNLRVPDNHGVSQLLKSKGIPTVYIQIAGGAWNDSTCSNRGSDVSNRAQLDNTQNTRFSTKGGMGIDHVIHLPQNCSVK